MIDNDGDAHTTDPANVTTQAPVQPAPTQHDKTTIGAASAALVTESGRMVWGEACDRVIGDFEDDHA